MLDPKPGRTRNIPRPVKLLSSARLFDAWRVSRDARSKPGRPGIDGITSQNFRAKLDSNLKILAKNLRDGAYGPSRLKAVFIPKENSDKERLICIPTVRDRLVQRAIIDYLVTTKRLPIYNSSSYGYIKGRGPKAAIARAIILRGTYDWCLKTDIEAFFDRIPRSYLKSRVAAALPSHSLTPLIWRMVDCEVKETPVLKIKLQKQGIKPGVGLRQGMPLSPILANLVLAKFDRAIQRSGIEMVRYADDILLFFHSKEAAKQGLNFIKAELGKIGLDIPELSDSSKTKITAPYQPVDFLGREIIYLKSAGRYVAQVSTKQISKIKLQLEKDYTYDARRKEGSTFQETLVDLWKSVSSYFGIYKDAYNFHTLDSELRGVARKIIRGIFVDIFGEDVLASVTDDGRSFLGIGQLEIPEPVNDLEL